MMGVARAKARGVGKARVKVTAVVQAKAGAARDAAVVRAAVQDAVVRVKVPAVSKGASFVRGAASVRGAGPEGARVEERGGEMIFKVMAVDRASRGSGR